MGPFLMPSPHCPFGVTHTDPKTSCCAGRSLGSLLQSSLRRRHKRSSSGAWDSCRASWKRPPLFQVSPRPYPPASCCKATRVEVCTVSTPPSHLAWARGATATPRTA